MIVPASRALAPPSAHLRRIHTGRICPLSRHRRRCYTFYASSAQSGTRASDKTFSRAFCLSPPARRPPMYFRVGRAYNLYMSARACLPPAAAPDQPQIALPPFSRPDADLSADSVVHRRRTLIEPLARGRVSPRVSKSVAWSPHRSFRNRLPRSHL